MHATSNRQWNEIMFRRIELIHAQQRIMRSDGKEVIVSARKRGLMGPSPDEVVFAWIYHLRGPSHNIPGNAKFYFTEVGWRIVGRDVMKACRLVGQQYRIIRMKESEVHVIWCDRANGLEVAAQPRKRRQVPAAAYK